MATWDVLAALGRPGCIMVPIRVANMEIPATYPGGFGVVLVSKQVNALALVATVEATRLDTQEAPQREVDRLKDQAEASRVKTEKARLVNKAAFRF